MPKTRIVATLSFASIATIWGITACEIEEYKNPSAVVAPIQETGLTINEVTLPQLKEVLSSHKGKVVLLNVWAIWCQPCKVEMPDLVHLHKNYSDSGFTLVLVSLDKPSLRDGKGKQYLQSLGVDFAVYAPADSINLEGFLTGIDDGWRGSIPFTVVYDRTGARDTAVTGYQSYETFEGRIKKLL